MPATSDTPMPILSAGATTQQYEELMQVGSRDFLTEPIRVDKHLQIVDHYLGDKLPE